MSIVQLEAETYKQCDFCGKKESEIGWFVESKSKHHICYQCATAAVSLFEQLAEIVYPTTTKGKSK